VCQHCRGGLVKFGGNIPTWGHCGYGVWRAMNRLRSVVGRFGVGMVRWVSVGAIGTNVGPYRHVTTSVCVVITRYSADRRTLGTPQRTLLLNTGPGRSRRRGDSSYERK